MGADLDVLVSLMKDNTAQEITKRKKVIFSF